MNWADTMKANSNVTSTHRYPGGARVNGRAPPTSWDPYEVWLTRIKQPRERAARVLTHGTSSSATSPTDLVPAR